MSDQQDEARPSDQWRQGDILPDELAESILARLAEERHCHPLRGIGRPGSLVLLSQDCDLVQPSLEKEPFAEAIWGHRDASIKVTDGNTPRMIFLQLDDHETAPHFRFEDRGRVVFPRSWLADHREFEHRMSQGQLRKLIRFVLRRYDRQPLPTAFNDRLRAAKVDKKIEKLLRKSQQDLKGVAIYLFLNTRSEPTPENPIEKYRALPVAVCEADEDAQREQARKDAADAVMNGDADAREPESYEALGIIGLLERCDGIEVVDDMQADVPAPFRGSGYVVSERQFTLDHRHDYRPWEFDHLSPDEDDARPMMPSE